MCNRMLRLQTIPKRRRIYETSAAVGLAPPSPPASVMDTSRLSVPLVAGPCGGNIPTENMQAFRAAESSNSLGADSVEGKRPFQPVGNLAKLG
jgi:hypothetical protein